MKSRNVGWAALAATLFSTHALAGSHLVATLTNNSRSAVSDQVIVTLTLKNDGDAPVHIFEPATPFIATGGRLSRDQFHVVDAFGRKASYRGVWVNWGGVPTSLFRLVRPGETLETTIDLTYEYDYGSGGPFSFRYELSMDWEPDPSQAPAGEVASIVRGDQEFVRSNEITVIAPAYHDRLASALAEPAMCSSDQYEKARRAWQKASLTANDAQVFTRDLPKSTSHPRYVKWFGDAALTHEKDDPDTPGTAYLDHVKGIVSATFSRLAFGTFSPLCGCDGWPDATAAHIEDRPYYRIFLCPAFFRQLEDGPSPSRVATLIHEYGHFVGDGRGPATADYGYGRGKAQGYAVNDPRTAIRNADNYEFYITDTTPYDGIAAEGAGSPQRE